MINRASAVQQAESSSQSSSSSFLAEPLLNTFPNEKIFCTSRHVRLTLEQGGGYPGVGGMYFADEGVLYLTNIRLVYFCMPPQKQFQSLDIPLERNIDTSDGKYLQSLRFSRSLIGGEDVQALVIPYPGGGIRAPGNLSLHFKKGGAQEFHSLYTYVITSILGSATAQNQQEEQLPQYSSTVQSDHTVLVPANPPSFQEAVESQEVPSAPPVVEDQFTSKQ
ncbi:hypothetical protein MIR68_012603 [Amoeboaphelidium protococcarum]|nr:hypothetical protein MIR68_012603 [Amoeboaphelidium protococcarum]